MELANEGLLCTDRIVPQIGPNHQVTMPPLKQSARIASLEYINRDQWYACGLPVPIMHIAPSACLRKKMRSNPPDQDKSLSLASTSNSRITDSVQLDDDQHEQQQQISCAVDLMTNKDANSCASSSKETCQQAWKEESSSLTLVDAFKRALSAEEHKGKATMVAEDLLPGVSGQSELKSSITSMVNGGSIAIKKRKKRRSCWQTLKRKGNNKKAKIEKGKFGKRWSGSLHSEVGEASGHGSAEGYERGESYGRILPGSQPDSWSEEEVAGFTLALYLFDKDFCAIKRFLETKKMKDILHFYYGKFYGTPAFCRWAGSKNSRNRKCVHGPRILQGWRQDELLRRLFPHFPDAVMDVIPQAVKAFNERELTVEGLASELKAAVGLEVLVHCVGIGAPIRDLTAVHGDPARHGNHHLGVGGSVRVESTVALTAGKACSSLSKEEMLDCLTGDFRISKTRAQDLFWEAVWPRLLAHGWYSIESEIPGPGGSKSSLVFVRPGVTKIARGSSERGVHYFDSASEVLKAVTNDPGLLDGVDELTGSGNTMEGSENQEDEDEEDEAEEEEEDMQEEWSDDMFETLDMHRLRRPRARKTAGRVKNAKVAFKAAPSSSPSSQEHAAQDSSESSSVDIDLNRPLSAVSSKPLELPNGEELEDVELHRSSEPGPTIASHQHHHRFPIEEIDLNLPPVDLDCNSPVGTTEEDAEVLLEQLHTAYTGSPVKCSSPIPISKKNKQVLDSKTWDPCPVVMPRVMAASIEMGSARLMGTINLNDPLPPSDMLVQEGVLDSTEQSRLGEQELFSVDNAGWRCIWPGVVELVPSDKNSVEKASPLLNKKASCRFGFADSCKHQSRKRVLIHQESEVFAQGIDYGKKLFPVPKKRAITFELPFKLNGLHTPNFIFCMQVATMNSWSRLGVQPLPGASDWRQEWNVRVSHSVEPFPVQEDFSCSTDSELPKCKVVELNDDVDAVNTETDEGNQTSEGHVQRSLSTMAPIAWQWGNVKRLRCHFSETEPPVSSSSYSRSKLQRLPRKYTISFDPRSGKNRLLKAKERCSDWSWAQNGRSSKIVVDTVSCCSTSHQFSSADLPDHQCASAKMQQEGFKSDYFENMLKWSKGTDSGYRRKTVDGESLWDNTSEPLTHEEGDTEGTTYAKLLSKDWKVPCLTLTAPGDSCEFPGLRRQMPRSRGFRSHGRSHSQSLQAKSIDSDFLNFGTGTKSFPNDLEELGIDKQTKMDTSYSLRSREMTEEDLLITLCSMQEQKFESGVISREVTPKLKGKRAPRIRRSNFSFMKFIFDDCEEEEEEEMEEELFVQPCTSQGPWQPTLPTTEKIMRSPKLRRRRSGLPCKSSCVVASTSPVASGSKSVGYSSKGHLGSRLPGQNVTGEEESTAAWNWPLHDVRFSLRRQLSDGSNRTDRLNGRKVPARWNQYPVC